MFAAAVVAAPPTTPVPIAQTGFFQAQQAEVGAALELLPTGRFRYALDYGAVSEMAEGRWTSDGRTVFLTSDPMPRLPAFVIVRDEPAPAGQYRVELENPGFDWGGPLEFVAQVDGSPAPVRLRPDAKGKVTGLTGAIRTISPIVPVYDLVANPVAIAGAGGHNLTFRFVRNDLGKARFASQPLTIDAGGLRLDRYGTTIRLVRSAPPQ